MGDSGALEGQVKGVEVPADVHVRCPLAQFRLRQVARHCPACPHFRGLADRLPGGRVPFAARYLVLCIAEPMKRELFDVEPSA